MALIDKTLARHCEQREAIQEDKGQRTRRPLGCFVAMLLAMTMTAGSSA
jgi:hypothetical protein